MRVQVRVQDLPPKKGMDYSMWSKEPEVGRLIALRKRVLEADGYEGVFAGDVRLELEVHIPPGEPRLLGDLDNFVTGICDGLMAASPQVSAILAGRRPTARTSGLSSRFSWRTIARWSVSRPKESPMPTQPGTGSSSRTQQPRSRSCGRTGRRSG